MQTQCGVSLGEAAPSLRSPTNRGRNFKMLDEDKRNALARSYLLRVSYGTGREREENLSLARERHADVLLKVQGLMIPRLASNDEMQTRFQRAG